MLHDLLLTALTRLNIVLASASVLIAFSLLAYLFVYNFANLVARAFVAVLAFVTFVYIGDVFLATAKLGANHPAAAFWLHFEWLGIAFVAPAYLQFSDALLATTGDRSRLRRLAIPIAYAAGAVVLAAVLGGRYVVGEVVGPAGAVRFTPGQYFELFSLGYFGLTVWGARNVWRTRSRALTGRSRWRMGYLLPSVIAPLSTFPYLTAGGGALAGNLLAFRSVAALANVAIAGMIVIVAYAVAYHGALTPDRALKRDLIKYLIQGPILGIFVIFMTLAVPERLQTSLGLPRELVLVLAVVVGIVAYQFLVRAFKPVVDWLVFSGEGRDAVWLRRLDERLLTTTDLAQLLENILTAMCDQLRVSTGCVVVHNRERGQLQLDAFTGSRRQAVAFLAALTPAAVQQLVAAESFTVLDGFRVHALRPVEGGGTLGLLAIEEPGRALSVEEEQAFGALIDSAERALEDRLIQQRVVEALLALEPELAGIQKLRGALERGSGALVGWGGPWSGIAVPAGDDPEGSAIDPHRSPGTNLQNDDLLTPTTTAGPRFDVDLIRSPDFPHWVKDALAHYWGGPKLTQSPLMGLKVAREALAANDYNAARAMRLVLDRGLQELRPEGERSMTASRWLIYNILELRFVKGLRVRDIARRLAVSESDLYRKQRVAVEALARQLEAMEEEEL